MIRGNARISLQLADADQYDVEVPETDYAKGFRLRVVEVAESSWTGHSGAWDGPKIWLSGYRYRADGKVGSRRDGTAGKEVDLPREVLAALVAARAVLS